MYVYYRSCVLPLVSELCIRHSRVSRKGRVDGTDSKPSDPGMRPAYPAGGTRTLSQSNVAACGEQSAASPTPVAGPGSDATVIPVAGAPTTMQIEANGFEFAPAEITIAAGTTVVWTNKEAAKHTVTAADGSFDRGRWTKGQLSRARSTHRAPSAISANSTAAPGRACSALSMSSPRRQ